MPIITIDGRQYQAKFIAKGQFSRAYRVGDRVVLFTRGDCAREVFAMYQYERLMHLPEMVRHDDVKTSLSSYWRWQCYSMPYYKNVRKQDRSAYVLMRHIIKVYGEFIREYHHYQYQAYGRVRDGIKTMQEFVNQSKHEFPYSVTKALQALVDVSSNCGYDNVGFDFTKSNFGVNEYGVLIFRDVVWVFSGA